MATVWVTVVVLVVNQNRNTGELSSSDLRDIPILSSECTEVDSLDGWILGIKDAGTELSMPSKLKGFTWSVHFSYFTNINTTLYSCFVIFCQGY